MFCQKSLPDGGDFWVDKPSIFHNACDIIYSMDSGQANSNQSPENSAQPVFTPPAGATPQPDNATTISHASAPSSHAQPAQPVTSGEVPTGPIVSGDTGDIVLRGEDKGNKHIPIIIAVVILAVFIIGGLAMLATSLLGSKVPTKDAVIEDFVAFRAYLEEGPANLEDYFDPAEKDEDEWFFEALADSSASVERRSEYANELKHKYQKFQETLDAASQGNTIILSDDLKNDLSNFGHIVAMINIYFSQNQINQKVLATYSTDGKDSAEALVEQLITDSNTRHDISNTYFNMLNHYYDNQIKLYEYYGQYGCIVDQEVDSDCATEHENDERIIALINSNTNIRLNLDNIFKNLASSIEASTDEILEKLRSTASE